MNEGQEDVVMVERHQGSRWCQAIVAVVTASQDRDPGYPWCHKSRTSDLEDAFIVVSMHVLQVPIQPRQHLSLEDMPSGRSSEALLTTLKT